MDLDLSRDSFIQHLQFEKRMSRHTLTAYESDLSQFSTFLQTSYEIGSFKDADHTVIRSWIVLLMEQGIQPRSVNRKITTLKSFYQYLICQGAITASPMDKVQSPKVPKRLPV